MKTNCWVLGAALAGSLVAVAGCGAGQYQIPTVAPVVQPKPEDDLLQDIENGDTTPTTNATPAAAAPEKPADKPTSSTEGPAPATTAAPAPAPESDATGKATTAKTGSKSPAKKK